VVPIAAIADDVHSGPLHSFTGWSMDSNGQRSRIRRNLSVVFGWVLAAPIWIKAILVLMILGGFLGAGYGYVLWSESQASAAAIRGWQKFEDGARTGDKDKMRTALEEVLTAEPGNELALARQAAIEGGESASNDKAMIFLTMKQNLRANKLPEAVREADKWLKFRKKDWMAHCIKAMEALTRGDRVEAGRHLDNLPTPDDVDAGIEPGGLLLAFRLFRALDRDVGPMRKFVQARVTAAIRTLSVQSLAPADKATILECWLEGFEPITSKPQPASMLESFGAALKLNDSAAEDAIAAGEIAPMARLARLGVPMTVAVTAFLLADQITAEQEADFRKDIETRTLKLWEAVKAQDDKLAEAYVGIAQSFARNKEYLKAREEIVRGLQTCGDNPDLSRMFSRMLQVEGRAKEALEGLTASARKFPDQPIWWALTAEAASASGRRDLALQACAEMRKIEPANRWAIRTEARLWIEAGDPNKAAQLLHSLGTTELATDADSTRLYGKALAMAGLSVQIDPFLEECEKVAIRFNTALPIIGVLRGWIDARPGPLAATAVAEHCRRLLVRWPEAAELYRVQALALAQLAEQVEPVWDSGRVSAAIQAAERFRAKTQDDRDIAVTLVELRLYGENNPEQAYRDASPLRDAESDPTLTSDQLELLGTAYRRTDKLTDAVRVLERANRSENAGAGVWIQLALAYHGQSRKAEARRALGRAQAMSRTPREQTDYVAAAQTLLREMQ